ncbi:MAG: methionyl-tRNA formyltransferase [Deltaproteobacteria bacterium]|nr:methionyl-tRNA formyltransferase [Deltaproteobacteria bacterium]
MEKPGILFMGTPEFAVPSLAALVDGGYRVIGVVTQPERPQGRGRLEISSPVKIFAEERGLSLYQPQRVRDESFLEVFRNLAPDLVVLVAFGQILPKAVIEGPPLGCVNVHPSLLPKYRGAAPINWAVMNGEKRTGVTIMYMNEGVDAGDIILQKETPIGEEEMYDDLHDRLSLMGAELLMRAVDGIIEGTAKRTPQNHAEATLAPRINREIGYIDWNDGVVKIVNQIRGLSSTPGAYSFLREKQLKIFAATGIVKETSGEKYPGAIGKLLESGLQVTAGDGHVYLQEIQLEGKRRMFIDEFLRGFKLSSDDTLE